MIINDIELTPITDFDEVEQPRELTYDEENKQDDDLQRARDINSARGL